jgi:hypothetical protein
MMALQRGQANRSSAPLCRVASSAICAMTGTWTAQPQYRHRLGAPALSSGAFKVARHFGHAKESMGGTLAVR